METRGNPILLVLARILKRQTQHGKWILVNYASLLILSFIIVRIVAVNTFWFNRIFCNRKRTFVSGYTIKRPKGVSATRARGVLMVKIQNICILS